MHVAHTQAHPVREEDLYVGGREGQHEDAEKPEKGSKGELVLVADEVHEGQTERIASSRSQTHYPRSKSMPLKRDEEKVMKRCTLPIQAIVEAG